MLAYIILIILVFSKMQLYLIVSSDLWRNPKRLEIVSEIRKKACKYYFHVIALVNDIYKFRIFYFPDSLKERI
jgi:hypothetical protein